MATVVIIHAADDALPARALAEKLRQAKLTVVLEQPFGEELHDAIRSSQVSLALWSPRSAAQAEMIDDVSFARGKSKLIHAAMQNTPVPEEFRGDKSVNLTGWRGEDDFAPWRELAKLVTDQAGVAPLAAAPRAASSFFQPGRADLAATESAGARRQAPTQQRAAAPAPREAPPQSAPRPAQRVVEPLHDYDPSEPEPSGGGGGMLIGLIALLVVGGLGGGGYFFWQQQQNAHAASTAWDSVDRNDPGALRSFIAAQSGPLKTQAQGALSELEERSFEAASDTDSVESLQEFLRQFPDSQHALAARGRIAELQANASNALPAGTTEDQPANSDLVPPGATTTQTPNATGGPAPLTPPGDSSTPQEPPSASTTTPAPTTTP